jgi:2-keto-4-pentenoate hydratase/2-oxohepta-3-ene-1,7-dioic acid hydratase in catechol pathway
MLMLGCDLGRPLARVGDRIDIFDAGARHPHQHPRGGGRMKHARVIYQGVTTRRHRKGRPAAAGRRPTGRRRCRHLAAAGEAHRQRPRTILALGLNYADHAKELAFKAPDEPLVFLKGENALNGHRQFTQRPADVQFMHYECELAIVVGKTAKKVKRDDAYDFIAGYTVANDYAIRDYLENWYRPNLRVKNRDGATPLGPWLVDAKDVPNPMALALRTTVNGQVTQQRQHEGHDLRRALPDRVLLQLHDAEPRRPDPDRHARRRRRLQAGRRDRHRDRGPGRPHEHHRHVPYKGGAPALQDLMGGQVPLMMLDLPSGVSAVKAGKVVPLLAMSAERIPQLPNVPTAKELGYGNVEAYTWQGLVAPAATPKEVQARLGAELQKAMGDAGVKQRLYDAGWEARPADATEMTRYTDAERKKWHALIKARDIKLD